MTRRSPRSLLRLLPVFVVVFLAVVVAMVVRAQGWLSPWGVASSREDSQVIQAIERTQEVALVGLGVQGITSEDRCAEVFGTCVPGSSEKVFLQYDFTAKLGIDGAEVQVTETGDSTYRISIPEFIFIGYDEPTFQIAVEDGGVLRWITPDIDKVEGASRPT